MIGQKDTTAIGRIARRREIAKTLGNYPELAGRRSERITNSTLVPFAELGHARSCRTPRRSNKNLIEQLAQRQ